jgi:molecular chaperone GrpE
VANEDDTEIPENQDLVVEEPTPEQLQQELEACQAQLAEANDKLLRARADAENIRKRGITDVENAHKYGVEKIARELLQVVDSLEKGLEAASATDAEHVAAMQEGMHLTYKLLMSTLDKFNIKQVDPLGQDFDPKVHEALTTQPTAELEPNKVLTVAQKGFVIHDRVLRPARVVVSKAPE